MMRNTFDPRTQTTRSLRGCWSHGLATAVGVGGLLLLFAPAAHAATINVNTTADTIADDGSCSLREAIIAANTNTASGAMANECAAGDPDGTATDIIMVPTGTYTLSLSGAANGGTSSAFLNVDSNLTIKGPLNGARTTIIQGDGSTFRIFDTGFSVQHTWEVDDVTISNGKATAPGCSGTDCMAGGIYNCFILTLRRVTVSGNQATTEAGGILDGSASNCGSLTTQLHIFESAITGNTAGTDGAGINNEAPGDIDIHNTTIANNIAVGSGGGIAQDNSSSTLTLNNVTIAFNTADNDADGTGDGGGVATLSGGAISLSNTIIASNTDKSSTTIDNDCASTLTSAGWNILQDTTGCSGITNGVNNDKVTNPDLAPLANYGGPTNSIGPNLLTDPPVNMGNPATADGAVPHCEAIDQRGLARPQGSTLRCDIGALELAFCGDGVLCSGSGCLGTNEPEQCDDGAANGTLASCCTTSCTFKPATTACDDGLFCTATDTCNASGVCSGTGDPCTGGAECNVVCNETDNNCFDPLGTPCTSDNNACSLDQCDGSGTCDHSVASGAVTCDDGLFCTATDLCVGATCVGSVDPCAGGPECANVCNEALNTCNLPAGTSCTSDGIFCNGTESCNGTGACSVHSGDPCPPPNTHDANCATSCNEGMLDCSLPDPDGTGCNDGLACNGADVCLSGTCSSHAMQCVPTITMAQGGSTTVMGFAAPNEGPGCIQVFSCGLDGICGNGDDAPPLGSGATNAVGKFTITVAPALTCPEKLYAIDTCQTSAAPVVGPTFVVFCPPAVPLMSVNVIALLVGILGVVGLLRLRAARATK